MVDSTNISTLPVDDTVVGDKRLTIDAAGNLVLTNQPFEHQITDAEINEDSETPSLVKGSQLLANDTFDGLSSAVAFVTAHPDKLSSLSTVSYRTQSECTTLGIDYPDGGGANYVIVPAGTGTDDGGSFIDVGAKQLKLITPEKLNVKHFGAVCDGVINDAVAVSNAADYAYINKIRFTYVDSDCYINGDVENKANVIFIGGGRFISKNNAGDRNIGIYRRQVIPESAPSARAYPDNIQKVMVKNESACTVVFLGDSLSTYAANSSSSSNTKSAYFQRMIRDSNPNTTFTFYNRSIGGRNASAINSVAGGNISQYEWYTDPARDWLEYVYDLNPDIVVLATGMNENLNFDPQDIYDIKNKIEANTSASIIFVADYLPTISPVGIRAGTSFAWFKAQEWRDRAAGFIRSYANSIGYPLIDLNRTFSMVRDGMDVLSQQYIQNEAYELDDGRLVVHDLGVGRAFSLRAVFEAGCFSSAQPVSIYLDHEEEHFAWLRESGGFIKIELRGKSGGLLSSHVTDLPIPLGDNTYEIVVSPTTLSIRDLSNGPAYAQYSVNCIKLGGTFKPNVKYFATTSGPLVSIAGYYKGVETSVMPTVLDYEFFGIVNSGYEDVVNGGDGQVHPSSLGLEALHGSHYSMQNFIITRRESEFYAEMEWEPGTIAVNDLAKTSMTVIGAKVGDFVQVSHTGANAGNGSNEIVISGWANANNNVVVIIQNISGGIRTIPSGTIRARVISNQ